MPLLIQPSLAGGEVSPEVQSRVDLLKYTTSLSACYNFEVLPYGGVANRPGLAYVSRAKYDATKCRLIEFEFNTTQAYVLEFGDLYMRVFKDGGHILEAGIAITGATQANPVVITTGGHGYANGDEVYISGVVGMTELNDEDYIVANVTGTTYELTDRDGNNIDGTGFTAYTSGGTGERVYEIVTPYVEADLPFLKVVQSADVLTITHPSYDIRELSRVDHDDWTLALVTFAPEQAFPEGLTVVVNTAGTETVRYTATAINAETAEESLMAIGATAAITGATQADPVVVTTGAAHGYLDGDRVHITGVVGMTEINDLHFIVANKTATTFELRYVDGTGYTAYTSGGVSARTFFEITTSAVSTDNTISWTADVNAGRYKVYREQNGIYGLIGDTENATFDDKNITLDLTTTPPQLRDPFVGVGDFPSTVAYYKQRRAFANTDLQTQTMWLTQTGHHNNMNASSPAQAGDAITVTIAAMRVNEIRHMVPLNELIVLTSGGEWLVRGIEGVVTANTIQITPQGYRGATEVQPLVIGDTLLYIQPGEHIRDLSYKFETDSYNGNDLSILARHLFEGYTIDDWTYAQAPNSIVWMVRSDGILLGQTYLREQEVYGVHRHETRGAFESVASIPEGLENSTYVVVERVIGGVSRRFIERFHTRTFAAIEDAFFVDSGLSLDAPIAISGYTQADPVVVTATAHGLSNGATVDIEGVFEVADDGDYHGHLSTDINGNTWKVANVTANTFELQTEGAVDVDGTGFAAYHSHGNVREALLVFSGLGHIEGEDVACLANGNVVKELTVTNGSITLTQPASRVHVGLPYLAEIETLNLDAGQGQSTMQSKKQKINKCNLRVNRSRGLWIGPDRDHMVEAKWRTNENYNEATRLLTGDVALHIQPSWNKNGRQVIQQPDPLPLTIAALIPDVTVGN